MSGLFRPLCQTILPTTLARVQLLTARSLAVGNGTSVPISGRPMFDWMAKLYIGTPPVEARVVVDTGSANLAVGTVSPARSRRLYIGSVSASPTACPEHGYGCAGTPFLFFLKNPVPTGAF